MEKIPNPENQKSAPIESLDLAEAKLIDQEKEHSAGFLLALKEFLARKFPNPEALMITEVEDDLL